MRCKGYSGSNAWMYSIYYLEGRNKDDGQPTAARKREKICYNSKRSALTVFDNYASVTFDNYASTITLR